MSTLQKQVYGNTVLGAYLDWQLGIAVQIPGSKQSYRKPFRHLSDVQIAKDGTGRALIDAYFWTDIPSSKYTYMIPVLC